MRFWCWWKLPEKWRRLQMSSRWWSLGTSWSEHKPLIGQSQSILGSDWFWADDFLSIFCHLRHRPVWLGDHMSSYLGPGSLSRDGEGGRWSEETGRQVHDHMVANSRVLCVRCRSRPCLDQAILRSAKFTPRWNKTKYFRLRQSYEEFRKLREIETWERPDWEWELLTRTNEWTLLAFLKLLTWPKIYKICKGSDCHKCTISVLLLKIV